MKHWIRVSVPMIQELSADWSGPVQVRLEKQSEDGELELIFRRWLPESRSDERGRASERRGTASKPS